MAGYTRQSIASIINGEDITAPPLTAEFNQLADAFNGSTGHAHDGTSGNAPKIDLTTSVTGYLPAVHGGIGGKNNFAATTNPLQTNDASEGYAPGSMWENTTTGRVFICVGNTNNAAVWRELVQIETSNVIKPIDHDSIDLGTPTVRFQDLYLSGGISASANAAIGGTLNVGGASTLASVTVSGATVLNGNTDIGNADTDTVTVTAKVDSNLIPSGTRNLGSSSDEWNNLYVDGTAHIDTLDVDENANIDGNLSVTGTLGVTGTTTYSTATGSNLTATGTINFANATVSNLGTVTTAAIGGGSLNNVVIGGSTPAAITGTTITGTSLVGPLTGNVTGNVTGNLTGNVTGNVTGNLTGNVTATSGTSNFTNVTISGQLNMDATSAATITNLTAPSSDLDAATKKYVDDAIDGLLDGAPGTLDTLNELAAALNDDASAYSTLNTAIGNKLPKSGGTMSGAINMGGQKITNAADPTAAQDLATKNYIDTTYIDYSSAADAANDAEKLAVNAEDVQYTLSDGSTTGYSALHYAAKAAASYDSFDDRYLGAKASDPTLDNDNNALITGALYFDSTNGVMKVYNGTEWANASSSIEGIKSNFYYTATSGQTAFSGSDDNSNTLVVDKADLVNVYMNGVRLHEDDYTVSAASDSVTLAAGAATGDLIYLEVFGNFAGQSGADVSITGGSITGITTFDVNAPLNTDKNLNIAATTANTFGFIEMGGPNGAYLDMKAPASDDFDARIIYSGSGNALSIITNADEPILLKHGDITRLATTNNSINVTGNLNVTSKVIASSSVIAASGSGGVSLNANDGYGNANIAFNHETGTPEQDGNAGRITVNTDATENASMAFQVGSGVTDGVATGLTQVATMFEGNINTTVPLRVTSGTATAPAYSFSGATSMGFYTSGGALRAATGGEERLAITSAGKMGFGVSNPTMKLEVDGDTLGTTSGDRLDMLRLSTLSTNADRLDFTIERTEDGSTWNSARHRIQRRVDNVEMGYIQFGANNDDLVTFGEGTTERVRIDGDGNVGIGTTAPSSLLHISSAAGNNAVIQLSTGDDTSSSAINFGDTSDNNVGLIEYNHTNNTMSFDVNAREIMRLKEDGTVVLQNNNTNKFSITASITDRTMTVTAANGTLKVGQYLYGGPTAVAFDTKIVALGTGTGGTGTYTVDKSQEVSSRTIYVTGDTTSAKTAGNRIRFADVDGAVLGGQPIGTLEAYTSDNNADTVGAYIGFQQNDTSPDVNIIFGTKRNTTAGSALEKIRLGYNGNWDMTAGGGNLLFADGAGINFGAVQGGGETSSLLNDYEEGTWTPTINSGTITATNTRYVKVGSQVTVYANIADISDNTSNTDILIGGLPYSSSSTNQSVGSAMYRYFTKTNSQQMNAYIGTNTTTMSLYWSFSTNSTWTPVEFEDGAQTGMDVIFTLTYFV